VVIDDDFRNPQRPHRIRQRAQPLQLAGRVVGRLEDHAILGGERNAVAAPLLGAPESVLRLAQKVHEAGRIARTGSDAGADRDLWRTVCPPASERRVLNAAARLLPNGARLVRVLVEEISLAARESDLVDQSSGVSARVAISALELLASNLERRAAMTDLTSLSASALAAKPAAGEVASV